MSHSFNSSEVYQYGDFTLDQYRELLEIAKRRYSFSSFTSAPEPWELVWRHDVDMSPERALQLAKIEREMGIKAHYFFMLTSEFYNLLAPQVVDIFCEIRSLGHELGLHYELLRESGDVTTGVLKQAGLIKEAAGIELSLLSFHNPTTLSQRLLDQEYVAGLLNVYGVGIKESYQYCSDSNGVWRHERLRDVLLKESDRPLHILTHPVWWTKEPQSPYGRIRSSTYEWAEGVMVNYSNELEKLGRKNIGFK